MPIFNEINAAFEGKGQFWFFSYSYGDMIYANYINDRFSEYKETIVTLFNKILKRTTTRTDCGDILKIVDECKDNEY